MEMILNIAWALFSLGLILLWFRGTRSNPIARRTQILALAMVVLLLLPVISLSDDLMAMQGPAETDTCLRKALHPSDLHPSVATVFWALPVAVVSEASLSGLAQHALDCHRWTARPDSLPRSLASRPPPQV